MVMFKITVFFIMLFGFFAVSWLWHRIWFGKRDELMRKPASEATVKTDERPARQPGVLTNVKTITAVLVAVVLIGLYLSTYWLLT